MGLLLCGGSCVRLVWVMQMRCLLGLEKLTRHDLQHGGADAVLAGFGFGDDGFDVGKSIFFRSSHPSVNYATNHSECKSASNRFIRALIVAGRASVFFAIQSSTAATLRARLGFFSGTSFRVTKPVTMNQPAGEPGKVESKIGSPQIV